MAKILYVSIGVTLMSFFLFATTTGLKCWECSSLEKNSSFCDKEIKNGSGATEKVCGDNEDYCYAIQGTIIEDNNTTATRRGCGTEHYCHSNNITNWNDTKIDEDGSERQVNVTGVKCQTCTDDLCNSVAKIEDKSDSADSLVASMVALCGMTVLVRVLN